MNDRPDARELLGAVRRFLEEEAAPALDGRRRYHARVAAHVVGMVARELDRGEADLRGEWEGLRALLAERGVEPVPPEDASGGALVAAVERANAELVRRIRAGEADAGPWRRAVLAHLRRVVDAKLAVSRGPAGPRSPSPATRRAPGAPHPGGTTESPEPRR